jgi:hypothetical protein
LSGPTVYKVSEAVGPLGFTPVVKQSIDAREVIIDFSRWLDTGESIATLSNFAILANPSASYPSWQTDFPFVTPTTPAPADTIPLVLIDGATVLSSSRAPADRQRHAWSRLYGVVPSDRGADSAPQGNRHPGQHQSAGEFFHDLVDNGSGSIGYGGQQHGGAGCRNYRLGQCEQYQRRRRSRLRCRPTPVLDQTINAKDVAGNAGTNAITWQGAAGALIDGAATFVWGVSSAADQFKWTGSGWSIL